MNKKIVSLALILGVIFLASLFFLKNTSAQQVCLPLTGYLVWPGTWTPGNVPMASSSQYTLANSPIYVSGSNVGIGYVSPVYTLQVNGDISGTRLCIGSDCKDQWPRGTIAGSGSPGQVTFWTAATDIGGDNNLFWDNTNKRLGIGTTTPQTSLHIIGNVTANTFLGTINAANVSSGQFGANTGGGNYSFMGNVGIGTTSPVYKLDVAGDVRWTGTLQGGSVPWARLTSFPAACPSGQYVSAIGTSLTCSTPPTGLSGSGTASYIPKWTGTYTLSNSQIYDNGTNVGIGTTSPQAKLDVVGTRSNTISNTTGISKVGGDDVYLYTGALAGNPSYAIWMQVMRTWDEAAFPLSLQPNGGNVGIGTTAPIDKLHIEGSRGYVHISGYQYTASGWGKYVSVGEIARGSTWPTYIPVGSVGFEANWDSDALFVGMQDRAGSNAKDAVIGWGDDIDDRLLFRFNNYPLVTILPSGNVGIGTTSPAYKLDVSGDARVTGILYATAISGTYTGTINAAYVSSGQFGVYTGGGDYYFPSKVGIGITSALAALEVRGTDLSRIIRIGSGGSTLWSLGITDSAGTYFRIASEDLINNPPFVIHKISGNVGIGTPSPAYKLDVSGDARVTGTLYATALSGAYTGTINAANVSSGQFGANTGGGNYSFMGNVGIGITNPNEKLDVGGFVRIQGGDGNGLRLLNTQTNTYYGVGVWGNRLEWYRNQSGSWYWAMLTSEGGKWRFGGYVDPNGPLLQVIGDTYISGNVGIGTPNTLANLHIRNLVNDAHLISLENNSRRYHFKIRNVRSFPPTGSFIISDETAAIERFVIDQDGNVGIGTSIPTYKLDVYGNIRTTGCLIYYGGTLGTCASDIALKTNIKDLHFSDALNKVLALQPKSFEFKNEPGKIYHGLIAQDIEKTIPELVVIDEDGYKRVKYGDIQWLLLEAIKEQQKEIEKQQKEIEELKKQLSSFR